MRKIELLKKLLLLQNMVVESSTNMTFKTTILSDYIRVDMDGTRYLFKTTERDNWVATLEKIENKIYEEE